MNKNVVKRIEELEERLDDLVDAYDESIDIIDGNTESIHEALDELYSMILRLAETALEFSQRTEKRVVALEARSDEHSDDLTDLERSYADLASQSLPAREKPISYDVAVGSVFFKVDSSELIQAIKKYLDA